MYVSNICTICGRGVYLPKSALMNFNCAKKNFHLNYDKAKLNDVVISKTKSVRCKGRNYSSQILVAHYGCLFPSKFTPGQKRRVN